MKRHPTGAKKQMSLSPQTRHIRVRVAEHARRGRKQWDLYRYLLDPHLLFDALKLVMRNKGSAGLNGKSISEIRGREWEFVKELQIKLKSGTYQPGVVKRVYIPKANGKKRPLGIPNLEDRVVQRALVLLMEVIYEQRFHNFSYGFRPNRKAVDCVAAVANQVYRHRFVLEADIKDFFGQVRHNRLLKQLSKEIVDPRIMKLISKILKTGFQEPGKPWQPSIKGTPQGGPLSPLLANIYLHHVLDERFHRVFGGDDRVKIFRYADDFVITARFPDKLKQAHRLLYTWMREGSLDLEDSKTREVDMRNGHRTYHSKFDFLGFKIHLRAFKDNPDRYWVARQPSEKARQSLRRSLREKLHPQLTISEARAKSLEVWRGWCNYFRYSNGNRIFYNETRYVRRCVYRYLARKFRRGKCSRKWRRLVPYCREIMKPIRPVRVIPNHLGHMQQVLL